MAMPTTKMIDDIRAVLSPLLTVSYVFGMRIVEYPAGKPRIWCGYLYIMIVWSTYNILLACTLIYYLNSISSVYRFCFWLNVFTAILTTALGTYHDEVGKYLYDSLIISNTLIFDLYNICVATIFDS